MVNVKEKVYEACLQLLPQETLDELPKEELIQLCSKQMGYYYGIMTTLLLDDNLEGIATLPKSNNWLELYNSIKEQIIFRPKYKLNPNVYIDPETGNYRVKLGAIGNLHAYKYGDEGKTFIATYAYKEDGSIRPTFLRTDKAFNRPMEVTADFEFDLFVQEVKDSVVLGKGNAINPVTKHLKDAELVALVADTKQGTAVYKLGNRLISMTGDCASDLEPSHEGELLKLY